VTKLGERYELIRRIGAGGMAEVWLAHDVELADRPVAIKIMHKHLLPNSADVARFEREMRFAAMMGHPNIVTVYTTGSCDAGPFLVMEHLKGHDLDRSLPGGGAGHIASIGRDICDGLAYAHGEGVIHRDIKPSNLFLCESGQVKITDFGVARAVGETMLSSAVLVGTFAYMPPERWRGDPSACSSDIWAAGCVLYRLISGVLPRQLPDVADYAAAAIRGEPVPDLHDITDAPGWLADTVMAMLADDPARRPTAGDCVRSLSSALCPTPLPWLPVGNWRLPGQLGPDEPAPGPLIGSVSTDPVTTPVARPSAVGTSAVGTSAVGISAVDTTTDRTRRPNRAVAAIGAAALLLLAGSVTAWRLSASPQAPSLAGGISPQGANHAAAASRSTSPSAAAATPSSAAAASPSTWPAGYRSTSTPGTASASPSGSVSGSPSPSGAASAAPSDSAEASSTPSAPTSAAPSLVAIPNVIGMNFTQAQRLLQSYGFAVVGQRGPQGSKVVSTSPSGQAPAGSVITVVYGS
jgi:eukaryotic-like serine/threonine-protein kinase